VRPRLPVPSLPGSRRSFRHQTVRRRIGGRHLPRSGHSDRADASIWTSVAFVVCHVSVVASPFCTEFGFAVKEAVAVGGAVLTVEERATVSCKRPTERATKS